MDLSDQRMACLRMAMDLNCKTEPLLQAANELMAFIAHGSETASQPSESKEQIVSEPVVDAIAACGTALVMPEVGGLELAEVVSTEERAAEPQDAPASETAEAVASAAPADVESPEAAVEQAANDDSVTDAADSAVTEVAEPDATGEVAEAAPEVEAASGATETAPESAVDQPSPADDEPAVEATVDVPALSQTVDAIAEVAAATQH